MDVTSSMEISAILNKIVAFWKFLNWPDPDGQQLILKDLLENILTIVLNYATSVREISNQIKQSVQNEIKKESFQILIVIANNLQRLRESLKIFVIELLEITFKRPELNLPAEELILSKPNESLLYVIRDLLEPIVENYIKRDIDSALFYLFESPDTSSPQEAASRLLSYLDPSLNELKEIAYKINFDMILKILWIKLLDHIETNLTEDKTVFNYI